MQIERHITGATGQLHLYPRDVANFWIPVLPETEQVRCETLAKQSRALKGRAIRLLDAAKRAVEIAIEDSEAAALAYLATANPPTAAD
jgi:type I restriction enzyme M protein